MVNRRRFIESGVAGSLAGAFAAWGPPAEALTGAALPVDEAPGESALQGSGSSGATGIDHRVTLHATVFDERFVEAVRFGREARRLGLAVRGLKGDVTDLWFTELHPLWKRQARPIAGLTAYAALFCLERLAWDHGMRVVYHGEHARLASGEVEHVLHGPLGSPEAGEALATPLDGRVDWPVQIASFIAQRQLRSTWSGMPAARRAAVTRLLTAGSARGQGVGQPLHSWVIAPPARA
ncbi:MAG: hypothetical protein WBE92_06735 [Steroidobacteraceae bacterium]